MRRGVGVWLAGAGAMLLLGIASRNGTPPGTSGPDRLPFLPSPSGTRVTNTPTPQAVPPNVELSVWLQHLVSQVTTLSVWLLAAAVAVVVIVFVVRVAHRVRVTGPRQAEGEVAEPLVDPGTLDDASAEALEELRRGGDVSGAVVACWRRLEDLAAASGAPRQPWQDTSEYVVEVLGSTAAPARDLRHLAELYRTACYAVTPLRATERHDAIRCLEHIRRALADELSEATTAG